MATFEQAEQLAREAIPEGHAIDPRYTEVIELGWYFIHRPREWVEAGDTQLIGAAAFVLMNL